MEKRIKLILKNGVSDLIFPGAVVGILNNNKIEIISFGKTDYSINSPSVNENTLYDVASITKSIPTSSLALYFYEQKQFNLEDPVNKFIPQFRHSNVKMLHLMTQSVSFEYNSKPLVLSKLKNKSYKEILDIIFDSELGGIPGEKYSYSNATSIILGKTIEIIGKSKLENLAQDIFFTPLGMNSTSFHPNLLKNSVIAPSEIDSWRKRTIIGEVHDESAYVLSKNGPVGSAGLFSTVNDLLIFSSMILHKGYFNNERFFSEKIIKTMYENQLNKTNLFSGLGWEINQPQYMGRLMGSTMFGKTGFTGCLVLIDVSKNKAMVLLSNYTYPKRKSDATQINFIRRKIADIIFDK